MKFTEKYDNFIKICRSINSSPIIPESQTAGLENNPKINPQIIPTPRDWFIDSFDWYVKLKLIRGEKYGPFYRIDGNDFWPTIGNMYDIYSESQCFFGLEKPNNFYDVKRLYNIRQETGQDYVYEIVFEIPLRQIIDDAYIFLGAVKDGEGFQVNPNGRVVEILRNKIIKQGIKRYSKYNNREYDYSKNQKYQINFMK